MVSHMVQLEASRNFFGAGIVRALILRASILIVISCGSGCGCGSNSSRRRRRHRRRRRGCGGAGGGFDASSCCLLWLPFLEPCRRVLALPPLHAVDPRQ